MIANQWSQGDVIMWYLEIKYACSYLHDVSMIDKISSPTVKQMIAFDAVECKSYVGGDSLLYWLSEMLSCVMWSWFESHAHGATEITDLIHWHSGQGNVELRALNQPLSSLVEPNKLVAMLRCFDLEMSHAHWLSRCVASLSGVPVGSNSSQI